MRSTTGNNIMCLGSDFMEEYWGMLILISLEDKNKKHCLPCELEKKMDKQVLYEEN